MIYDFPYVGEVSAVLVTVGVCLPKLGAATPGNK